MNASQREKWLYSIWPNQLLDNHQKIIDLFKIETQNYHDGIDSEYYENLYQSALYLYIIGDVRDSILIYDTKISSFDLSCGIDFQFILGAGFDATYDHAKNLNRIDFLNFMETLKADPDINLLKDWLDYRKQYFKLT